MIYLCHVVEIKTEKEITLYKVPTFFDRKQVELNLIFLIFFYIYIIWFDFILKAKFKVCGCITSYFEQVYTKVFSNFKKASYRCMCAK